MPFTVYRSSAGSGKTFTLVKEYLKILLQNPEDFRHILAITFTNKAANEMKERVLSALRELSAGNSNGDRKISAVLLQTLMKESGMDQPEIAGRARQALELILHHYSDFAIGTIDSFSHKLIRTFAHDFKLPVNFNVEIETDELLSSAVDLLLERVGEDQDLTTLLVGFIESRLDEDKGWSIDDILRKFAKNLLDEEGIARIERLRDVSLHQFRQISTELTRNIRSFERQIRELASTAHTLIQQQNIPVSAFFQGDKGLSKFFQNLSAGRLDKMDPNSYVLKTIYEDKWFSGKIQPCDRDAITALKPELIGHFEKIQGFSKEYSPEYKLRKLLAKTIYPLAVLNEIEKVLDEFKRQNNLIHISEFNSRIASIVMNEPVPFIYERLGEKYHHLLIDEFQDTSVLQWMNFIPLIENSLASGYFNLVVGDGKQAIYRWRSGDIEQFNALPSILGSDLNPVLKLREHALSSHYQSINLDRNFRSRAEIVDFNNRFFNSIAPKILTRGKEKVFEDVEQKYDPQNTGGYISLEFLTPEGLQSVDEGQTFHRILEIICQAAERNFAWKDMAILCRSNKNAAQIAGFLLANGIDVVSAESLLIHNSLKVRFVIAILRMLFESPNDIVKEEIRLFLSEYKPDAIGLISSLPDELAVLPIFDLCETIIRKFDLNRTADTYLQFFLDVVLNFSAKTSHSVSDFLTFWDKNRQKFSIIIPEELDAVRVLTIHKAKGLQYPLVILPYAQESRKNTKSYLWVDLDASVMPGLDTALLKTDKEMESTVYKVDYQEEQQKSMLDLINLLYVAMTRPEEQLYILTSRPPADSESLDSLSKFFASFLVSEGVFEEDQDRYEFGNPMDHRVSELKQKTEAIILNELISSDWQKRITIRTKAPLFWDPDNPMKKSDWGNRVHTVLSWIRIAADLPLAIHRAILTGLIESKEASQLSDKLLSVVHHPELTAIFDEQAKIKTEPEILLPQGAFYRPDRVVISKNSVFVVDYKTGMHHPEYALQINRYAGYLTEMGYEIVRCLVVYLEPEVSVVEV